MERWKLRGDYLVVFLVLRLDTGFLLEGLVLLADPSLVDLREEGFVLLADPSLVNLGEDGFVALAFTGLDEAACFVPEEDVLVALALVAFGLEVFAVRLDVDLAGRRM